MSFVHFTVAIVVDAVADFFLWKRCCANEVTSNTKIGTGTATLVAFPLAFINYAVAVVVDVVTNLFNILKTFVDLFVAVIVDAVADLGLTQRLTVCVLNLTFVADLVLSSGVAVFSGAR